MRKPKIKYKKVVAYNENLNSNWINWFNRYQCPVLNTFWDVFMYCLCNTSYMGNVERDAIKNGDITVYYVEDKGE